MGREKETSPHSESAFQNDSDVLRGTQFGCRTCPLTDNAASSSSQRKPIVWKDENGSTSAPEPEPVGTTELESAPPSGLLPTPARGRSRTRRARYANTSVGYSRGRGSDNVWTSAAQRGRRTTRRRSMY
ncbi:hypothetical protein TNCT_349651 [Trichonephila clavata]|uniref:Uncharacterized protein n=1 Tax=Trichonephila clavata TaxID=2740835 RepID=A0A8X6J0R9_TRICU|nr:hypothetical protein TNCT_349651 [Trichonephila clavata]